MSAPVSPALSPEAKAIVRETLEALRGQFDVVRSELSLGGRLVTIHHPRNADELIDEEAFAVDERLPYWADVWPSARVLAEHIVGMRPDAGRILELGCGAGLVSVAAAMAGFEVILIDKIPEHVEAMIRATAEVMKTWTPSDGARPAGVHLYGPFFAADKIGAHPKEGRRDPTPAEFTRYFASGIIRSATCAAELP